MVYHLGALAQMAQMAQLAQLAQLASEDAGSFSRRQPRGRQTQLAFGLAYHFALCSMISLQTSTLICATIPLAISTLTVTCVTGIFVTSHCYLQYIAIQEQQKDRYTGSQRSDIDQMLHAFNVSIYSDGLAKGRRAGLKNAEKHL